MKRVTPSVSSTSLSRPGTLVHARGREWVVLPDSDDELLMLRPVSGLDEEMTGILPAIEPVRSAKFPLPSHKDLGDFHSGRLLRDAARLSTRAAAGPFRSFGRIAVEPRPYQLVPLMMALKLNPVRMLIADDVGIGKTIEACLVARELLDRGEIRRMTVLCPPHLAEQWQRELEEKFHIEAELVLSSTITRLERDLRIGESVFERHPFTVVSTDFIKAARRAEDFALKCPEFVIVDEAHGCTLAGGAGRGRHQRHELLKRLTVNRERHILLVTATPHSGNEEAFRSLLSLLDSNFVNLPTDAGKAERAGIRRQLARHLVQRRRADIRRYLDANTPFPERQDKEVTYSPSPDYRKLFDDIVAFARGYVADDDGERRIRRVRYWSALALLRCVSSSPAAAAATLRSRAAVDDVEEDEVDDIGRRTVLDQGDDDDTLPLDIVPGSDTGRNRDATHRRLLELARRAEALSSTEDLKLQGAAREIRSFLKAGFHPIIFCRFVDTADYVATNLRESLPKTVRVEAVTGRLPPAERETRIASLAADGGKFVLVCTDCLSEGINLQDHFDAVLHYDLAWNPTRHEQREGRVDRFGQKRPEVRVITYYGDRNPVDGIILDVLIRKHKSIKNDLGVTVAVPGTSAQIAEALFEGALFKHEAGASPQQISLDFIDEIAAQKQTLHDDWDNARDLEKASRSRFAQRSLKPEEVQKELENVRAAIGSSTDVARFLSDVLYTANIPFSANAPLGTSRVSVNIGKDTPRSLRQAIGQDKSFSGCFDLPIPDGAKYLGRTSPIIEGLASWILDQALDSESRDGARVASRCGAIFTSAVSERTTLLVTRFRFHIRGTARGESSDVGNGSNHDRILCEEIVPLAHTGTAAAPCWLPLPEGDQLLSAPPSGNMLPSAIHQQLDHMLLPSLEQIQSVLAPVASERAEAQLAAHRRVRAASGPPTPGTRTSRAAIEPVLPVDILGAYILLPPLN